MFSCIYSEEEQWPAYASKPKVLPVQLARHSVSLLGRNGFSLNSLVQAIIRSMPKAELARGRQLGGNPYEAMPGIDW